MNGVLFFCNLCRTFAVYRLSTESSYRNSSAGDLHPASHFLFLLWEQTQMFPLHFTVDCGNMWLLKNRIWRGGDLALFSGRLQNIIIDLGLECLNWETGGGGIEQSLARKRQRSNKLIYSFTVPSKTLGCQWSILQAEWEISLLLLVLKLWYFK